MNDEHFDRLVASTADWEKLRTRLRYHRGATISADAVLDWMDAIEMRRAADRQRTERRSAP